MTNKKMIVWMLVLLICIAGASATAIPEPSNIWSHRANDTNSNNMVDLQNNANCTLRNPRNITDRFGEPNRAVSYKKVAGNAGSATCNGNASNFNPEGTILMWYKRNTSDSSASEIIATKGGSGTPHPSVIFTAYEASSNSSRFQVGSGSEDSNNNFFTDNWNFIGFTTNSTKTEFYRNGTSWGTATTEVNASSNEEPFYICRWAGSPDSFYCDGFMGFYYVWNQTLTNLEITQIYAWEKQNCSYPYKGCPNATTNLTVNFSILGGEVLNFTFLIYNSTFTYYNQSVLSNQTVSINLSSGDYTLRGEDNNGYFINSKSITLSNNWEEGESNATNVTLEIGGQINITFYDEETERVITENGSINIVPLTTNTWLNSSVLNGNVRSFNLETVSWYRIDYVFDNYNKRSYYYNKVAKNQTNNLTFYSLLTASADFVVIHVEDESANKLSNVSVKLFRAYPSQSEYRVVEMARTDENGDAVFSVVPNEQWYYLSFEYKGQILLVSDPQKFSVTTYTFTLFLTEDYTGIIDDLNSVYGVVNYTNASNNFRFVYDDPNQKITEACLDVEQMVFGRPTLVCSNCSTATAATLLCNMASEANGTYTGQGFVTLSGKKYLISSWSAAIGNDWGSKLPSTFLSFFVVLGFAGMAAFNPVAAVVLTLMGIIFSALLNIAWLSWGSVIGLIIVGGVIIVKKGVNL